MELFIYKIWNCINSAAPGGSITGSYAKFLAGRCCVRSLK